MHVILNIHIFLTHPTLNIHTILPHPTPNITQYHFPLLLITTLYLHILHPPNITIYQPTAHYPLSTHIYLQSCRERNQGKDLGNQTEAGFFNFLNSG